MSLVGEPPPSPGLRRVVVTMNIAWALWAFIGGFYFLTSHDSAANQNTAWFVFHDKLMYGYTVVGISLLICGITSMVGIFLHKAAKAAALLCAAWCGATAVTLQLATPVFDQGDIDAWLLLMCAFTCVMRWALLVLEPYVCE